MKTILMNLCMNSGHEEYREIIAEFMKVGSYMISLVNSWIWIHHWISDAEFYSEIMINTELSYKMLKCWVQRGRFFNSPRMALPLVLQAAHCQSHLPHPGHPQQQTPPYPPPLLLLRLQPAAPSEENRGAFSPSCAARTAGMPSRPACSTDPDSSRSLHWRGHPRGYLWQIDRASKRAGTRGRQ